MDYLIHKFYPSLETDTFFKILCIVSFLVITIDFIWIKLVMLKEYTALISDIQKTSIAVRLIPTILSYATIILPIVLFSLPRLSKDSRLEDSLVYGGLLGVMMYGMFSFTNYALLDRWTLRVLLLDTLWGGVLYTVVTYLTSLFF